MYVSTSSGKQSASGGGADPAPKPSRRVFSPEYKRAMVAEYENAANGEKGAILRREGLYSSHIIEWTRARDAGQLGHAGAEKTDAATTVAGSRVKKSAEQISYLIREMMSETGKVVSSMADGTSRVDSGREVVEKTGSALERIVESSRVGANAAAEISVAIQAVADSTEQIFTSINDMAAIAQETAASAEEVTAAIHEQKATAEDVANASLDLAGLAAKLHEMTEGFKL